MKVNFIRHAETTYNRKKIFQGRKDCELSLKGIEETIKKSVNFPQNFDAIFCSPLLRTKQTAEILLPNHKIIYDERIVEKGLGDWEDTTSTKEKLQLLDEEFVPPNGETREEIESRIQSFAEMLKKDYIEKNILVITHFGVIYEFYRMIGIPLEPVENLEIVEIEIGS